LAVPPVLVLTKYNPDAKSDISMSFKFLNCCTWIPEMVNTFHSDRGSQYASYLFTDIIKDYNGPVIQSMSRKGNCWDNAVAESFFKSLKTEWVYKHKDNYRSQAELSIFSWIETWYNKRRIHSPLGYKTINEFEMEMYN
jgi:transposase InsO family protein